MANAWMERGRILKGFHDKKRLQKAFQSALSHFYTLVMKGKSFAFSVGNFVVIYLNIQRPAKPGEKIKKYLQTQLTSSCIISQGAKVLQ